MGTVVLMRERTSQSAQAPKFEFVSNAKPSLFAYPAPTNPPKKEAVGKVATAVLSTTAKVKAREKKKAAAEGEAMETVSSNYWPNSSFMLTPNRTRRSSRRTPSQSRRRTPTSR